MKKTKTKMDELKAVFDFLEIEHKEVLNSKEAARYLNISIKYLYTLVSKGMIPHYKPNAGRLYFARKELMKWMLRNKRG